MSVRVLLNGGPQHGRVINHDGAESPGITIVMPRIPEDGPMVEDLYEWSGYADDAAHLAVFTGTRAIPEPGPELLKAGPGELGNDLAAFRVGGFDDEGDLPSEPVKVTCTRCGHSSPWLTYRDDGGADRTTPLDELVRWAREHTCAPRL